MAMGKCRECGREVSTGAATCPGCGVKNPTTTKGARVFGLIAVFGVLVLAYRCSTRDERHAAAPDGVPALAAVSEPKTVIGPLTAAALIDDYKANEVKADLKYKGKRFRLSGPVSGISSGIGDEPTVHLVNDLMGVNVHGLSKASAAALSKGDAFAADCTVTGEVIGSPIVDCS